MKAYSILSAEGVRVTVVTDSEAEAVKLLRKTFEINNYWGFYCERIEEMPVEGILPELGEVMISYTVRI